MIGMIDIGLMTATRISAPTIEKNPVMKYHAMLGIR
jgi:hypothetical protein